MRKSFYYVLLVSFLSGCLLSLPDIDEPGFFDCDTDFDCEFGYFCGGDDICIEDNDSQESSLEFEFEVDSVALFSGEVFTLTLLVLDADGFVVSDFAEDVVLSASDGELDVRNIAAAEFFDGEAEVDIRIAELSEDTDVELRATADSIDLSSADSFRIAVPADGIQLDADRTEVRNGETISVVLTVGDTEGFGVATSYNGLFTFIAPPGSGQISPMTVDIVDGRASVNVTLSGFDGDDAVFELTGSTSDLFVDNETIVNVFGGVVVESSDFAGGYTVSSLVEYLPPRSSSAPVINVGGNIIVPSGTTLRIFEGATLNMNDNGIVVMGKLEFLGTDAERIRVFSSAGAGWKGIDVGDDSGEAVLRIRGASLSGFESTPIRIGSASSPLTNATSVVVEHSRIALDDRISSTLNAILIRNLSLSAVVDIKNNIFVADTGSSSFQGFIRDNVLTHSGTVDIMVRYNTFVAKTSMTGGGSAIYLREGSSVTNTIERNLVTGFVAGSGNRRTPQGIEVAGDSQTLGALRYNVFDVLMRYKGDDDVFEDGEVDNLWEESASGINPPNTFSGTLNETTFQSYGGGDFRFSAQSGTVPLLNQVNNFTSMAGCLTAGNSNEVGAYGNGGFAPLPSEESP